MSEVHDPRMGENGPQQAATNGGYVCVWVRTTSGRPRTSCGHEWFMNNTQHPIHDFPMCPFCGKKIEIKH